MLLVAKKPGPALDLDVARAAIPLASLHGAAPLPPYVRLIHDVLLGDRSLFTRPDGLAAVWQVAEPLLTSPPPSAGTRPAHGARRRPASSSPPGTGSWASNHPAAAPAGPLSRSRPCALAPAATAGARACHCCWLAALVGPGADACSRAASPRCWRSRPARPDRGPGPAIPSRLPGPGGTGTRPGRRDPGLPVARIQWHRTITGDMQARTTRAWDGGFRTFCHGCRVGYGPDGSELTASCPAAGRTGSNSEPLAVGQGQLGSTILSSRPDRPEQTMLWRRSGSRGASRRMPGSGSAAEARYVG